MDFFLALQLNLKLQLSSTTENKLLVIIDSWVGVNRGFFCCPEMPRRTPKSVLPPRECQVSVLLLKRKLLAKPFLTPPTPALLSFVAQRCSSSSKPLCLKSLPRSSSIKVNGDMWSKIRPGR